MPLRSAVRSPGPSLALGLSTSHPGGPSPPHFPEACDMGSEPLAWLLCGRADTSRCSATEPGSRLSPRGGGGAWLSGDRPAGCRRTLMTTWQGLPLGTPDCKGSAAGEKGPRALELGDLDSGPSCTGPWPSRGPFEVGARSSPSGGQLGRWRTSRWARRSGQVPAPRQQPPPRSPPPGPSPSPCPTRRRPRCYLSQDAATSLPLHTCSLRGFSSCCLGSRL